MATGDKRPVVMSADRAAAYGIATLGADAKLSDSQIPIQKIMAVTNAAEYSSANTYALGSYCTRNGKLYRCTTAITTSETWTDAHWTETTVGAELVDIYTALSNKAPAGYGLGTNAKDISGVDFNTVRDNGWYMFATAGENRPYDNMGYSYMLVAKRSNENLTQIVFIGNAADYAGCIVKRVNLSGTWYPWEWVNPPMYLGVEYRTTERYLGKPVYVKTVSTGTMPAASGLSNRVLVGCGVNADILDTVVRWNGTATDGDSVLTLPVTPANGLSIALQGYMYKRSVYIESNGDYSAYSGTITFAYTKKTD